MYIILFCCHIVQYYEKIKELEKKWRKKKKEKKDKKKIRKRSKKREKKREKKENTREGQRRVVGPAPGAVVGGLTIVMGRQVPIMQQPVQLQVPPVGHFADPLKTEYPFPFKYEPRPQTPRAVPLRTAGGGMHGLSSASGGRQPPHMHARRSQRGGSVGQSIDDDHERMMAQMREQYEQELQKRRQAHEDDVRNFRQKVQAVAEGNMNKLVMNKGHVPYIMKLKLRKEKFLNIKD